jgi:hypothetical protein
VEKLLLRLQESMGYLRVMISPRLVLIYFVRGFEIRTPNEKTSSENPYNVYRERHALDQSSAHLVLDTPRDPFQQSGGYFWTKNNTEEWRIDWDDKSGMKMLTWHCF